MFPEELGIKFKEYVDSIKTERYDLEDKRKIISELRIILEKSVEKRIIEEISGDERHRLFAQ